MLTSFVDVRSMQLVSAVIKLDGIFILLCLLAAGDLVGFLFQLLGSVVQLREDEGLAVLVACSGIYA